MFLIVTAGTIKFRAAAAILHRFRLTFLDAVEFALDSFTYELEFIHPTVDN